MSIRILVADDHKIVLEGLVRLLKEQKDVDVVGQANDGEATVKLALELAPEIIIMDFSMPKISGLEATRRIHNEKPDIKIIGLSMHAVRKYAEEMYRAGARGYLLKDCDLDELMAAIHAVVAGGTYFTRKLPDVTVAEADRGSRANGG